MTTPTHVLCSNVTEIGRQKVGETMRCFGDKKFAKCVFVPIWQKAPKVCRERATWPCYMVRSYGRYNSAYTA